jgi:hypothetical protein
MVQKAELLRRFFVPLKSDLNERMESEEHIT